MKWYNKNKSEAFEFVLISTEPSNKKVQSYLKKKKIQFPALKPSTKEIVKDLRARKALPWIVIMDQDGKKIYNSSALKAISSLDKYLEKTRKKNM